MRDIKFRAKELHSRAWEYGAFHMHTLVRHCPFDNKSGNKKMAVIVRDGVSDWEMPVPLEVVEVEADTVCQYTGFTDRNGKKIYEGDIVDINNPINHIEAVVIFNDGCFDVVNKILNFRDYLKCYVANHCVTVTGNIYDNDDAFYKVMSGKITAGGD